MAARSGSGNRWTNSELAVLLQAFKRAQATFGRLYYHSFSSSNGYGYLLMLPITQDPTRRTGE
ncbi:hypothetical protein FRC14_004348 [Serendipita sp. 396]|nr:hypothetical protein FRC14_004348 [Serendipita sp. 396]KAG9053212.1 hypothetical protein FS842_008495 [Serendipita sp. 407]